MKSKNIKKFIPFIILLLLILFIYITNAHAFFTIDWLHKEEIRLTTYAKNHPILAPCIYLSIYILSVCLVIPDSTILTLLGSMIFPHPEGLILAVVSETLGATIFFAVFHALFGTSFMRHERPFLSTLRRRFQKNSMSYLLFLRISHVVPFWLTNVAAAYFKIPCWTFVWTTFVGVIPLTWIITNAGHSLSKAFAENKIMTLSDIFTPQVKLALIILGILSLCPIVYKKWISKRKWKL